MKKLIIFILLSTFLSLSTFGAKIAKLDIRKIMTTIKQGKQIQSKLKQEYETKQKILKKSEGKIKKCALIMISSQWL